MKTVTAEMKAGDLKGIINLPNYPGDQRVEITVPSYIEPKKLTKEEIKRALDELKGILKQADKSEPLKTREEYRMERLEEKYGPFD